MSQNQIVKHVPSQLLFPLHMKGVNELFPGFEQGDFAVLHGLHSVNSLISLLCVQAQLPTQLGGLCSNVVYIDGGNTFRLYQITRIAQLQKLNPKQVLDNIYISRAFTAYQVTSLIMQHLKETVKQYNSKLVVISDIAGFFLDNDIPDDEAQRIFSQLTVYLSNFARENQIVLIATYLPHKESKRDTFLKTLTCSRASVVLSLRKTGTDREVVLEKHPRLNSGLVKLPSNNVTLESFFGANSYGENS
jgi:hypothetical protein